MHKQNIGQKYVCAYRISHNRVTSFVKGYQIMVFTWPLVLYNLITSEI